MSKKHRGKGASGPQTTDRGGTVVGGTKVGLRVGAGGGNVYGDANRTVYPSHAPADTTTPTADPFDRAHGVRDATGLLVPAPKLNGQATARKFPACALTATRVKRVRRVDGSVVLRPIGRVSFESEFEATAARAARLSEMGLHTSTGGGVAGAVQEALGRMLARNGGEGMVRGLGGVSR